MKTNFIFLTIFLSLSAHGMNQHQNIIEAARDRDLQAVQQFIAGGADLNQQNKYGCTALMFAADRGGHQAVVQCLVQAGADLNQQDNGGSTALMRAAWKGRQAIVQCLVQAGAYLNQQDNHGRTALMRAAIYGRQAVVQYLVQAGADLNQQNKYGWTALMFAADGGHQAVVQCLVQAGADLNQQDNDGWTALMYAADVGQKACCELLVNRLMKIPSDAQKENLYAFLICMKRLDVVKDLRQHCFKKHLFADIEQVNWEKPEQSLAWQEIAKIKNEAMKETLMAYCKQGKTNEN